MCVGVPGYSGVINISVTPDDTAAVLLEAQS